MCWIGLSDWARNGDKYGEGVFSDKNVVEKCTDWILDI